MASGTFMAQREAELNAGRERITQISDRADPSVKRNMRNLFKEADREREEDEKRREEILNVAGVEANMIRDRAGAEIVDQAQTELEAMGHLADRQERIIALDQQLEMERQEGNADPEGATELTTDHVTAQAVNQPTVLANNAGVPTEDRALNVTGLVVTPSPIPDERHVPKTRKRAEQIAKNKVPAAREVVKPGWHGDKNAPDKVREENANVAVEVVEGADPVALSVDDALIDNVLS